MRHRKSKKILGRTKQPREMMLRNLAASIIIYEKVKTTQSKAKAARPLVEKIITISKQNNLIARRKLMQLIPQPLAVKKLMEVINKRYSDRQSGYTRIIKLNQRAGDSAVLAQIELV
ncbi:MAG: 50S ribosomal protein L17 [Patescibacteria group bacterium]